MFCYLSGEFMISGEVLSFVPRPVMSWDEIAQRPKLVWNCWGKHVRTGMLVYSKKFSTLNNYNLDIKNPFLIKKKRSGGNPLQSCSEYVHCCPSKECRYSDICIFVLVCFWIWNFWAFDTLTMGHGCPTLSVKGQCECRVSF